MIAAEMTPIIGVEDPNSPSRILTSLGPILDAAWKLGLFVTLSLYTVGLIIQTAEVEAFGGIPLELNKTVYVLIGIQWLLQASYGFIAARQLRQAFIELLVTAKSIKTKASGAIGLLLTLVVFCVFYILLSMPLRLGALPDRFTFWMFTIALGTGFALDAPIRHFATLAKEKALLDGGGLLLFGTVGRNGIFVPLMVLMYAGITFPAIPKSFGGGLMPTAELFVKPGSEQAFKNMGLTIQHSSIGNWTIVAELPNAFVITDFKLMSGITPRSLWIRKDDVEGLSYVTKSGPNLLR